MRQESKQPTLCSCQWLDLEQMRDSTILITGGTGLIGYNVLSLLAEVQPALNLRILALVRNEEKARKVFAPFIDRVVLICGDVLDKLDIEEPIHYLIHGASITASAAFVDYPVETIMTSIHGTSNMLQLCCKKQMRSMVYLSSMEVYGSPQQAQLLTETDVGYLDPLKVRSSYSESKRMCETLCISYAKEYGVNVKIARLAQTFGSGSQPGDKRVVAYFLRCALRQENIVIKASGESSRMYLDGFDAATALLTLLLKGENAQAYNIANKDSYCSIKRLAQIIARLFCPKLRIEVNAGTEAERAVYPPDSYLRLDTSRLEALGWRAAFTLEESLCRFGKEMKQGS